MLTTPLVSRPSGGTELSKYPKRPMLGQACRRCFSVLVANNYDGGKKCSPKFVNILYPPAQMGRNSFVARLIPDLYYCFVRSTTFEHRYHDVRQNVVDSDRVIDGVERAIITQDVNVASEELELVKSKHFLRVQSIVSKMCAHINRFIINVTGWVLLKCLRRLFRTIQVVENQMIQLREASKEKLPIVFLPNHRSHLDYILLTFAVWQWDVRIPHVAAGDNLNLPVFSYILRSLGGFFIKRRLDNKRGEKDFVYRSVLHSYLSELLKHVENVEFYVEGGRSRSGKCLLPKNGLLAAVIQTYLEASISDCYLVPVSISYEKIIDTGFLSELWGEEKIPETFFGAVKGIWKIFRSQFGSVRIDFAQPYRLKDLLDSLVNLQNEAKSSDFEFLSSSVLNAKATDISVTSSRNSLSSIDGISDDTRQLIKSCCRHIAFDFTENVAQMCTHLLAFLLLNKYPNGGRLGDVIDDFHYLTCQVIRRPRDVGFSGDARDVVLYAAELLGPELISLDVSDSDSGIELRSSCEDMNALIIRPASRLPQVLRLAYYKNSVVSVFLLESIVANAVLSLVPSDALLNGDAVLLLEKQIIERCFQLCDLLRFEFLFSRPCVSLKESLEEAVQLFVEDDVLRPIFRSFKRASEIFDEDNSSTNHEDDELLTNGPKANETSFYLPNKETFSNSRTNSNDTQFEVNFCLDLAVERLKFMANVLKPFLHSYLFATELLDGELFKKNKMNETQFAKYLLAEAKKSIENTSKSNFSIEFVNLENFRNYVKWIVQKQVGYIKGGDDPEENVLSLNESFETNFELLNVFKTSVRSLCSVALVF